jgi:hypothetical protein
LPDKRAATDQSQVIDASIAVARIQNWTAVLVRVGIPRLELRIETAPGEGFVNNPPLELGGDFHIYAHP